MKKKIIALLIIVTVLSVLLAGCGLITLDESRDYHQVIGRVSYKSMSEEIYKGELANVVATTGAMYVQYQQGMTYTQVAEILYNQMISNKISLMFAKEYVAKNGTGGIAKVEDDAAIAALAIKEFLTVDELRYCIEETNKSLRNSWDSVIKELKEEIAANNKTDSSDDEEDEEKEDELAARPIKPATTEEEDSDYVDQGMTDASLLPSDFFTIAEQEIKEQSDKEEKSVMRNALKDLRKRLSGNYATFDSLLEETCESRVLRKYQEVVGDQVASRITPDDIKIALNNRIKAGEETYAEFDAYNTAMTGKDQAFSFYHNTSGFVNVKSVLFKFSETQTSALNLIKNNYASNKDYINEYREKLALKAGDSLGYATGGIKVNLSNPKYDASKDELKTAYTDKDVDYKIILAAMAKDIKNKVDRVSAKIDQGTYSELEKRLILEQAKIDAFTDWIYLANDDPGMYESSHYTVTPDGRESTYVEEYTILARKLYKEGAQVGSMAIKSAGSSYLAEKLGYAGSTELLSAVNGADIEIVKDSVTMKNENGLDIKTDVFTFKGDVDISFIINDYGIQIIMIDSLPLDVSSEVEGNDNDGYSVKGGYLYSSSVKIIYKKDAEGNYTQEIDKIIVDHQTVNEYLIETKKDALISDHSGAMLNELTSNENYLYRNQKVYDKFIKTLPN